MPGQKTEGLVIPSGLVDAVRAFPVRREVEHCGVRFEVSAFDIYAGCPQCGAMVKLRAFSAGDELEDLFDAVFEWMLKPGAMVAADRRIAEIRDDSDE